MTADRNPTLRPEAQPVGDWERLTDDQRRGLERLLAMMQESLVRLANAPPRDDRSLPWLFDERHSQLAFINGRRGTGKTTLLTTLAKALDDQRFRASLTAGAKNDTERAIRVAERGAGLSGRVVILEPLDMEPLPRATPLLAAILARLNQAVRRLSSAGHSESRLLTGDWHDEREFLRLQQYQARVAGALETNLPERRSQLDGEQYSREVMDQEHNRLELLANFEQVLYGLSADLQRRRQGAAKDTRDAPLLFLVPIDDVDLNPARCVDLLRLLRSYSPPQLFFVLLGQYDLVEQIMKLKMADEYYNVHPRLEALPVVPVEELTKELVEVAASNVRKLVPPSGRIELASIGIGQIMEFRPLLDDRLIQPAPAPTLADLCARFELPSVTVGGKSFGTLDRLLRGQPVWLEDPLPITTQDAAQFPWSEYCGLGALQSSARRLVDLWLEMQKLDAENETASTPQDSARPPVLVLVERLWNRVVDEDAQLTVDMRKRLKEEKQAACELSPQTEFMAERDFEIEGSAITVASGGTDRTKPRYQPRFQTASLVPRSGVPRAAMRNRGAPGTSPPDAGEIRDPRTRCALVLLHDVAAMCPRPVRDMLPSASAPIFPIRLVWPDAAGKLQPMSWPLPPLTTLAEMVLFFGRVRHALQPILSRQATAAPAIPVNDICDLVQAWIAAGLVGLEVQEAATEFLGRLAAQARNELADDSDEVEIARWRTMIVEVHNLREQAAADRSEWRLAQIDEWLRQVALLLMPEMCSLPVSRRLIHQIEKADVNHSLERLLKQNVGLLRNRREQQLSVFNSPDDRGLKQALNVPPEADSWLFISLPEVTSKPPEEAATASAVQNVKAEVQRSQLYSLLERGKTEEMTNPSTSRATYQRACEIAEEIVHENPNDSKSLRDLSLAFDSLGNVLLRLDKVEAARDAYLRALEIDERLAQVNPRDIQLQRGLSVSHSRMGNVLLRLNKLDASREAHLRGLQIAEELARSHPDDLQIQRSLSLSYNKIGDVYLRLNDLQAAREAYRQAMEIRQRLAESDPDSTQSQRDLAISHGKLGDVFLRLNQLSEAQNAYRRALQIDKQLAREHPRDSQTQRDLSVSHGKMGDVSLRLDRIDEARDSYNRALTIDKRLAKASPSDSRAQRDLADSLTKIGDVFQRLNKKSEAQASFRRALDMIEKLLRTNPTDNLSRVELAKISGKLAEVAESKSAQLSLRKRALALLQAERVRDIPFDPDVEEIYLHLKSIFETETETAPTSGTDRKRQTAKKRASKKAN
ncbi:MAG: tetratricopeptide repeat protein [Planctomycetia bacterium]|nr:tetratricopeptide repeat protein [Planctomycetia bacterium]